MKHATELVSRVSSIDISNRKVEHNSLSHNDLKQQGWVILTYPYTHNYI